MQFYKVLIPFLILNFGALGLGSWLMNNGPRSEWYINLNQAPWTPPGWVFGLAWTAIMICFSIYMAQLYIKMPTKEVLILFAFQFLLNVSWNYIFFNKHQVLFGLIVIILLTLLVTYFFFRFHSVDTRYLLTPYILWLCIATSLNAYILLNN
ncbi:TspO/MBR family protein [Oceanihabitans sediminis]|uniref:Tryptophan-rich sensory protein n=1 Tax=Oceanihabitans sediminis TaxID=1812012 RepID=A0A368P474_9FLAO|nr:TspO/MBR family protein [Oceanihabitans sediminis]MDX1277884.1 TspO/MBR family protein [Oceanihabitans sediminis]MDX1774499.1 TspO/MBR family protein [Oceanihabitans sediminis]RBP27786.1 TspO/MBR related protein [Oceanihabitans sediminis]RCU56569.1 tryptophan-rich sensory protein [Oceanihabitans sediminis]